MTTLQIIMCCWLTGAISFVLGCIWGGMKKTDDNEVSDSFEQYLSKRKK